MDLPSLMLLQYPHSQISLPLYHKRQVHSSLAFTRNIPPCCNCLQGAVGNHKARLRLIKSPESLEQYNKLLWFESFCFSKYSAMNTLAVRFIVCALLCGEGKLTVKNWSTTRLHQHAELQNSEPWCNIYLVRTPLWTDVMKRIMFFWEKSFFFFFLSNFLSKKKSSSYE